METLILKKICNMLVEMGFVEVPEGTMPKTSIDVQSEKVFCLNNKYCRPQYFASIGFFIEYAQTYEDAKKNWYDDGETFPLELGEKAILNELRKELIGCIEELQKQKPLQSTYAVAV